MTNFIEEETPPDQVNLVAERISTCHSGVRLRLIKEVKTDSAKHRQKGTCTFDSQVEDKYSLAWLTENKANNRDCRTDSGGAEYK